MRLRPARNRSRGGEPRVQYYPLQGGEDLVSPAFKASPGTLRYSTNYECDEDGRYRRIDGYEVFDGQPKPSDASYWKLGFTDGDAAMTEGDLVTGATSTATGTLLNQVLESGSYAGSDAAGYLILWNVSGTFQDDENLQVSAVTEAVADGVAVERGMSSDDDDATYLQEAIEYARDQIAALTGSGNPLGVWQYNGVKYAFRNNAGGTKAVMYKSTTTGWSECDLGRSLAFTSGGTTEISEEDVITGATSGATATVKRVILTSGTWAGGDAAGTFIIYSQTGTFQSENLNVGAASNLATISGNSTENTLVASGDYYFVNHNFYGASDKYRMYGCDGVSKGFEWDGSVFVPITTGMTTDTPERVFVFQNQLFYTFSGGSLQHSSIGDPYTWDPITGANEIGIGMDIVGAIEMPGPSFIIFGRNTTWILTGNNVDDWDLSHYSLETGVIADTITKLSGGIFLDDRGLTYLAAAQEYGNFQDAVISKAVTPFLRDRMSNIQCACAFKDKNQYRLYFDTKEVLTLTISQGKIVGYMRQELDEQFLKVISTEDANGNEEIFATCDDGFIYQIDKGTSFNGDAILTILLTHFNHLKSPSNKKRIRRIELELEAPIDTELNATVEFDYSDTSSRGAETFEIPSLGGIWNVNDWNDFVWGGVTVGSAVIKPNGSGKNFSLIITSEMTYTDPHTIQGITVHYDIRGLKR